MRKRTLPEDRTRFQMLAGDDTELGEACEKHCITGRAERGRTVDPPCFDVSAMIGWRITLRYPPPDQRERQPGEGHRAYLLRRRPRLMKLDFYQGNGHKEMPTVADVLHCLLMDASVLHSRDFEEWADDLGLDTDSRKAEQTYRRCLEQTEKLETLLGSDLIEELSAIEH